MAFHTIMVDRVIEEPNSMWVRILKGLYYPMGDLISAKQGESIMGMAEYIEGTRHNKAGRAMENRKWSECSSAQ